MRVVTSTAAGRLLFATVLALAAVVSVEAQQQVVQETGQGMAGDPARAAAFRLLRQQDENGAIPDGALQRARAQADALRAADPFHPGVAGISNSTWQWLGPANIGGRIRTIVIHPTTASTLFIGSVGGGIWKSTTSGASWTVVNDVMANLAVSSMIIHPTTPSIMYAGTGEGFYNFGRLRGAGILKSSDGGVTWTQLGATATADFHYVNRLAMSADGASILAGTSVGLFRSTDAGASWVRVLTPATGFPDILDVKFLAGSNTRAVASGFSKNAFYSADGGASWTAAAGLTPQAGGFFRVEIGVSVSSPSTVYLSVDAGGGASAPGEVWKSTDSGASYAMTPAKPDHFDGQGFFDNAIWVDPTNPNRVVVGGTRLAATTDGGASWTRRAYAAGIPADTHAIVSDPGYNGTTNKRVYIGNDSGIYTTADITASPFTAVAFTSLNNGLGITQLYGGAGHNGSGKIIAGAQDNGTLLSTPAGGTTWTSLFGFDGGFVAADPVDANYLYGENAFLQLHRNTTGGTAASELIYGHSNAGGCKAPPYVITDACTNAANYVAPFVLDPNNANTLLAGGRSLWRTTDVKAALTTTTGPAWTAIKPADPAALNNYISAIAVAPADSNIIWVGHNLNGAIYKTINGTAAAPAWVNMRSGALPLRYIARIAVDPANSDIVYVAFAGFSVSNLWKTINGGATWAPASGSGATALPEAPIYSVAVHPTVPGWIYAGTEVGIFASTDGGASWSLPHDGPANVSVEELFWMGSSLVAATHGRGMFMNTCMYTLSPASANVPYNGGSGTVTVTASSGECAWAPSSDAAWLAVTGGATGNGTFTYTAQPSSTTQRTGTIRIGHTTFVVTQATASLTTVDRASLSFGAIRNGGTLTAMTGSQTVTVSGTATWIATTTAPWLSVGSGSGTGSGRFTVSIVNAPGLPAAGTVSGSVTVTSGGANNPPQTIAVSLSVYPAAATSAAIGAFDTPAAGASVAGSIAVTGWALDDIEVSRVEIWRDKVTGETTPGYTGGGPGQGKVFIANAFFVSGARPDVEAAYPGAPLAYRAGWGYLLLTWGLWNQGNGMFTLYAFAYDKEGHASTLGSKVITSSNATATRPFGGIDTPGYGETVSGGSWNFGWALTPNSQAACTIGAAGVQVAIDSGPLLPVAYGDMRPDIAAAFPGFTNGAGAGGAYFMDTTTLANGTHQIGWFVTDNCGRADGIGSRFFTVLNGGTSSSTTTEPAAVERGSMAAKLDVNRLTAEEPIEVRRGLDTTLVFPGSLGDRVVAIAQGERVEVQLPFVDGATYAGYQIVNGERRALPLGSSFDPASGTFYWQPVAAFLGVHDLQFVPSAGGLVRIRAVVGTGVQAAIDLPGSGVVSSSFVIAGWAIDLAAASGSGIDTVHVWAYPTSGARPIFLGVAGYGDARPDIGWLFGDQFTPASYSLVVNHLPAGAYDLVVYPHSAVAGDFHGARAVRVVVQ